ncbi:GYDIA family GHMP kinase [Flavicella sp.]|uniref:GYDIA family GHMP kinase n=1 Tax=Flavicella sp. TaxID=2957742 RepID=UPI00301B15C4
MEHYYSNGKLLISGEYAVLDGAKSLALPAKFGQSLEVSLLDVPVLIWESFSCEKQLWFQAEIQLDNLKQLSSEPKLATLQKILIAAQELNPEFLKDGKGAFVQTFLTFPNEWGLGTSSTLINNIASWAKIDAFTLLNNSFGGSGYDIACAQNDTPVVYKTENLIASVEPVSFNPEFIDNIYFVYLNKKQDSKEGIQLYRDTEGNKNEFVSVITSITDKIVLADSLSEFENFLKEHEQVTGSFLNIIPLQEQLFHDYPGAIKSLGAWGGDFILVTGDRNTPNYFIERGFDTVIAYRDMIL